MDVTDEFNLGQTFSSARFCCAYQIGEFRAGIPAQESMGLFIKKVTVYTPTFGGFLHCTVNLEHKHI